MQHTALGAVQIGFEGEIQCVGSNPRTVNVFQPQSNGVNGVANSWDERGGMGDGGTIDVVGIVFAGYRIAIYVTISFIFEDEGFERFFPFVDKIGENGFRSVHFVEFLHFCGSDYSCVLRQLVDGCEVIADVIAAHVKNAQSGGSVIENSFLDINAVGIVVGPSGLVVRHAMDGCGDAFGGRADTDDVLRIAFKCVD